MIQKTKKRLTSRVFILPNKTFSLIFAFDLIPNKSFAEVCFCSMIFQSDVNYHYSMLTFPFSTNLQSNVSLMERAKYTKIPKVCLDIKNKLVQLMIK